MKIYLVYTLIKSFGEVTNSYVLSSGVKVIKQCIILLALFGTLVAYGAPTFIINDAKSDYTIYSGKEATVAEKNAASELRKYLKAATGADLPITEKYTGSRQILVGLLPEAAALLPKIDFNTLKPDEILICPAGNNLILAGERPRGTLYAVYTFLEKRLGIRFWTASEEFVPHSPRFEMPDKKLHYAPKIGIRALSSYSLMHDGAFAVKSKIQGPMFKIPLKWGGSIELIGPWHTFDRFLPVGKYLKSHPEYFSLRNGTRVGGQSMGQLCLSNPEMRREFLKMTLAELRKHPNPKFISVTQNDNKSYCQCDRCQKIDKAGGGPSASMIRFVNFIAKNVEKEYPGVIIQTFAYQYTRHAPTDVKPRKNVSIFMATIEQDISRPLNDPQSKRNAAIMKDLKAWEKISSQIDIWDYVTSFSSLLLPVPNLDSACSNIKTFGAAKPHMVMMQWDIFNPGAVGDLQALKTWVWSKLLWNPDADPAALEKEFITGYYGRATSQVEKYLQLRRNAIKRNREPATCFTYGAPWLDAKTLFAGLKILNEGEQLVANDPVLRKRLDVLAKPFEYTLLEQYSSLRSMPKCPSVKRAQQVAVDWLAFMNENKIVNWAEEWGTATAIIGIRNSLKKISEGKALTYKLPPFLKKLKKEDYFLIEENAFAIHGGDKMAKIVDDPLATNGVALALQHRVYGWSPKLFFRSPMSKDIEYDVYAAIRLKKLARGEVCEFSGWDGKAIYMTKHIDASEIKVNAYTYVLVGSGKLRSTGYFFFGAKVNPQIKSSLVDHLVFVKK